MSPRLRQIREAVEAFAIDSGSVLNHATPRIFFGLELHANAREELLGFSPESEGHPASVIASLWRQRWLARRIQNPEILAKVSATDSATLASFFHASSRAAASPASEDPEPDFVFEAL
jgi:hypothetical protein